MFKLDLMKKLLVISEPNIISDKRCTRNNALDSILFKYKLYFSEVHYLGPTNQKSDKVFSANGIIYHPIQGYSKNFLRRIFFFVFSHFFERRINNIINEIKPDIIQIRLPSLFSSAIYKVLKRQNYPITSYIAGEWDKALKLNYKRTPFINFIAKNFFDSQKDIIKNTIPVCTGNVLKDRFIDTNPNCYAYYSTTHDSIKKREVFNHPSFNILSVGRLEELKRNIDAIYALKYLLRYSNKYHLTFMGEGAEKKKLIEVTKKNNLANNISFLGHISDKKTIENIFESNDILLHTSLSEGTTKVLPEAMAFGLLPIAVKDVGSNNYILSHGNGFLIEPMNPESIADTILKYNELSREEAEHIIECGYDYAEKHTIKNELDRMWQYVFNNL